MQLMPSQQQSWGGGTEAEGTETQPLMETNLDLFSAPCLTLPALPEPGLH